MSVPGGMGHRRTESYAVIHRMGPNTDPCGTPYSTGLFSSLFLPVYAIHRSLRYEYRMRRTRYGDTLKRFSVSIIPSQVGVGLCSFPSIAILELAVDGNGLDLGCCCGPVRWTQSPRSAPSLCIGGWIVS
jgi:hypothetical protein